MPVKKGGNHIIELTDYYSLISEPGQGVLGLSSPKQFTIVLFSKIDYAMEFHRLSDDVKPRFKFIFNIVTHEFLNNTKFTQYPYEDSIQKIIGYMDNPKLHDKQLRAIEKKYGWDKHFMLSGTMRTPHQSPEH